MIDRNEHGGGPANLQTAVLEFTSGEDGSEVGVLALYPDIDSLVDAVRRDVGNGSRRLTVGELDVSDLSFPRLMSQDALTVSALRDGDSTAEAVCQRQLQQTSALVIPKRPGGAEAVVARMSALEGRLSSAGFRQFVVTAKDAHFDDAAGDTEQSSGSTMFESVAPAVPARAAGSRRGALQGFLTMVILAGIASAAVMKGISTAATAFAEASPAVQLAAAAAVAFAVGVGATVIGQRLYRKRRCSIREMRADIDALRRDVEGYRAEVLQMRGQCETLGKQSSEGQR